MVLKIEISSLEIKLSNLTLKSKLQTLVLAVSLVTVGLIDWASYSQERSLIGEQISQNLQLIRDFKGEQIELLFNNISDQLHFISGDVSPIAATAVGDVELVVLYDKDIVHLIQKNAKFGLEMTEFIEERKRTIRLIKGRDRDETDQD